MHHIKIVVLCLSETPRDQCYYGKVLSGSEDGDADIMPFCGIVGSPPFFTDRDDTEILAEHPDPSHPCWFRLAAGLREMPGNRATGLKNAIFCGGAGGEQCFDINQERIRFREPGVSFRQSWSQKNMLLEREDICWWYHKLRK